MNVIRIIFRVLGWLLVILFFLFAGLSVLIGGALTFPIGILIWIFGGLVWTFVLATFISLRQEWLEAKTGTRIANRKYYESKRKQAIAEIVTMLERLVTD